MQKNESLYLEDWFRIGAKELRRAEILLNYGDIEGAGFNIQQALEKYLKGFLLSKGWKLRKIHNLEILLNDTVEYESSFEEFRQDCSKITYYYIEERYPLAIATGITGEEMENSLQIAKKMIDKMLKIMKT